MNVELLAITPNSEKLIEHAGRVCYRSCGENTEGFIKARIIAGHGSILEHASATFEVSGISRACSHQLVRHRVASYSQESMRYVDIRDNDMLDFPGLDEEMRGWIEDHYEQARSLYESLVAYGVKKEDARFVLPIATATRIVVTMNFRELRHFFGTRLSKQAQWEIRNVAREMLRLVREYAPSVFYDIKE